MSPTPVAPGFICACGYDLGRVTLKTTGLCPVCDRSKWMQVAEGMKPRSNAIAAGMNKRWARTCVHRAMPCISRCGVEEVEHVIVAIPSARRREWFERVNELNRQDAERRANRR